MTRLDKVCSLALDTFGRNQLIKAAEEFAELSAALSKYWINPDDDAFENVLEEYVDARIMMRQMELLLGLDNRCGRTMDLTLYKLELMTSRIPESDM